jgi:rhamnose utilization protein RhaD (predicted bifunctional aldolase and dehydrogenase)
VNASKNNKTAMNLDSDQTTDKIKKSRTCVVKFLTLTPSVEKTVKLHGFINREILVNVDHNTMALHLTISDCEGF